MVEPVEARAMKAETVEVAMPLSGVNKLPSNFLFDVPRLLVEEITFLASELRDRAEAEMHLFNEWLSKMAEAHSVNDIAAMFEMCGQHQMDFIRRDCERLLKHAQRSVDVWSRLFD